MNQPIKPMHWQGDDAPPQGRRLSELAWNLARLLATFRKRGPRGPLDGQPVLVIPGFLCSDQTTFALRRELARAGFRVHGWKLGWNLGAKADTLEQLRNRIEGLGHKRPIVIVGWSLGGIFGREFARYHPELVKALVTLGSPFSGDPRQNTVWPLYERIAGHAVDDPPIPRITDKPPVPHLAIWSREDGLIAPRSAHGLRHLTQGRPRRGGRGISLPRRARASRVPQPELKNGVCRAHRIAPAVEP